MSQNNPPFKVKCINDYWDGPATASPKIGEECMVTEIIHSIINKRTPFYKLAGYPDDFVYTHESFIPIKQSYSDATAEILENFKSPAETPDKVIVPEKVTNHL